MEIRECFCDSRRGCTLPAEPVCPNAKLPNLDIKVGDRVRSYDFAHSRDCYVEGAVIGFRPVEGCERYEIAVERVVWAGEQVDDYRTSSAQRIYPPVNGTPKLFGGVCNGVEKL